MTKSESEPLGEVSGIVMPEGCNLNTYASGDEKLLYHMINFVKIPKMCFSSISGVCARKLDCAFVMSQLLLGVITIFTWKT